MLADADNLPMRASAADVLARDSSESRPASLCAPLSGVPRPLARLLPKSIEELDWRRVAPGVKDYNLSCQPRASGAFKLLHLAPGAVLSDHSHSDRELTFVVRGSYSDELGQYVAGDIADLNGNHSHQPIVGSKEPCIALFATSAPVRYSGILGRIMQPFIGI